MLRLRVRVLGWTALVVRCSENVHLLLMLKRCFDLLFFFLLFIFNFNELQEWSRAKCQCHLELSWFSRLRCWDKVILCCFAVEKVYGSTSTTKGHLSKPLTLSLQAPFEKLLCVFKMSPRFHLLTFNHSAALSLFFGDSSAALCAEITKCVY